MPFPFHMHALPNELHADGEALVQFEAEGEDNEEEEVENNSNAEEDGGGVQNEYPEEEEGETRV